MYRFKVYKNGEYVISSIQVDSIEKLKKNRKLLSSLYPSPTYELRAFKGEEEIKLISA